MARSFVPILATKKLVAPLANNTINSGRSIWSLRHHKHQNLSTGDDFIHKSGMIFLILFLATRELVAPLANDPIMSGRLIQTSRHLECKNYGLFQILFPEQDVATITAEEQRRNRGEAQFY